MRWSEGGRKQVVSETRVRASEWKTDEITQKHTMPRAAIYSWKQSCSQFCLSQHSLNYADETAAACCGTMDVEKAGGQGTDPRLQGGRGFAPTKGSNKLFPKNSGDLLLISMSTM